MDQFSDETVSNLRLCLMESETKVARLHTALEVLQEVNAQNLLLWNKISDFIFVLHTNLVILNATPSIYRFLGYHKEELIGRTLKEIGILTKEGLESVKDVVATVIDGGQANTIVCEFINKKGTTKSGEVYIEPLSAGKQVTITMMVKDITDKRVTEEELLKREEEYSVLVEKSPDGIVVLKGTRILFANQRMCQISGRSLSQLLGHDFSVQMLEQMPEDMSPAEYKELVEIIKNSASDENWSMPHTYTFPTKKINGEEIWLQVKRNPIVYKGDKARLTFVRDITPLKLAEKALQENERKFRTIMESSPDAIIVTDAKFAIVDCNQATLEMYDYSAKEELVGSDASILVTPTQRKKVAATFAKACESGLVRNVEYTMLTKNGRNFFGEASTSVIRNQTDKVEFLVSVIKDITERKKADEMIRLSEVQARLLSHRILEAQEKEAARISREVHDHIGSQLVFLAIQASALSNKLDNMPELQSQIDDLIDIAEQLKNSSREIAAHVGTRILDDIGFARTVEWYVEEFERRTKISCLVDTPVDDIEIDRQVAVAAYRMLQESLTNVIKHSKASQVDVKVTQNNGTLIMQVADNGIGIDMQNLKNMSTLGLLSIRERARLVGGKVKITGRPNKGTKLTFRLPVNI